MTPEEYDSRQKILSVIEQIEAPAICGSKSILCPYCEKFNLEGAVLCCDLLRKAVITHLMGQRNDAIAREIGNHTSN